jgi:hypothetical protein
MRVIAFVCPSGPSATMRMERRSLRATGRRECVYGKLRYNLSALSNSILDRGEWSVSHSGRFTSSEIAQDHSRHSDWLRAERLPVGARFLSSPPVLGPTQPPIQWVPGALSAGVKWPGREADHSPPKSAEVKNTWIYTSTPPYIFMV